MTSNSTLFSKADHVRLERGYALATSIGLTLKTASPDDIKTMTTVAVALLLPYTTPDYYHPKAAYTLGRMQISMGLFLLKNGSEPDAVYPYFDNAAQFLDQCLSTPGGDNTRTHTRAKEALADLYESGLLEERKPDYFKAFTYRLMAAHDGSIAAQWKTACAYEKGYGVEESLPQAVYWMKRATTNSTPMNPGFQRQLTQTLARLESDLARALDFAGLGPSEREEIQNIATFGTPQFLTLTQQ